MNGPIKPINSEQLTLSGPKKTDWTDEMKQLEERLRDMKRTGMHTPAQQGAAGSADANAASGKALRGNTLMESLAYVQFMNQQEKPKKEERKRSKPSRRYDNSLGSDLMPDGGRKHKEYPQP
ncbi:hypothetical protein PAE9249_04141 [Paenibacillus sp. CECT 9249]|uniref:hypothetical protein n=1 Tax=Paenibacillus sp. CECT 9249 TaxID=2845385 RepID=UPI001E2A9236|nr:hypothetical protein [Paenibacillus sp. CECT 9249]CAH0121609.1 hypothetical protein PAE9249_04141 [Paenibacillus sp. CECT 9249]